MDLELYYQPRIDKTVNMWKPPRSHFDSVTKRTVIRMDHFCPFTGNVIGILNHGHFILMYFFAHIGLGYGLVQILLTLHYRIREASQNQEDWLAFSSFAAAARNEMSKDSVRGQMQMLDVVHREMQMAQGCWL